jgi:hypothetical protein
MRIRDGDSSDPGFVMEKSRIRDKHPGSATLLPSGMSVSKFEVWRCKKISEPACHKVRVP